LGNNFHSKLYGWLFAMKLATRLLSNYLLPVTTLIVVAVMLISLVPLDGALWRESLNVGGEIKSFSRISCTYSFGFWKNHPEEWPVEEIAIGGETYSKDKAIEILETPPAGDATYILAHQLIAAKLNILNTGDDQEIIQTLNVADLWLAKNGLGNKPEKSDKKTVVEMAGILESYNIGKIGPGHCNDEEQDSLSASEIADLIMTPEDLALPTLTDETPTPTPGLYGTSISAGLIVNGFGGQNVVGGSSEAVNSQGVDTFAVNGQLCVINTGNAATRDLMALLQLQYKLENGSFQDLPGVFFGIIPSEELAPSATRCFDYQMDFKPMKEVEEYQVAALVTITNYSGYLPGGQLCPGPATCPFGPLSIVTFTYGPTNLPTETLTPTSTPTRLMPTNTSLPTMVGTATNSPTPTSTPSPTPTEVPTNSPTSTPTPTDVPTIVPTGTPLPLTETPTDVPTETPLPTTETAVPTATETTLPTDTVP
jgi:hypothetical protein